MINNLHREITPLKSDDSFLVFDRKKKLFDFPIHLHDEYELNFIHNARKAGRIVGNHSSAITDLEMVLVGPNLYHGWEQWDCTSPEIHEVTIQFERDFLSDFLLNKKILYPVKELLEHSNRGVSFSYETCKSMMPRIIKLSSKEGFDYLIEFLTILYDLSVSRNQVLLSNISMEYEEINQREKIHQIYGYIHNHFYEKIKLKDIADEFNMTVISFSRLIKQKTGKTFVEFLNEFRISHTTRMLQESSNSIFEIAFDCGFYNQANFNRIFKKHKKCTPSEYKSRFNGVRKIN